MDAERRTMLNGKIKLSRIALMLVAGLALIAVGLIVTWPSPSPCCDDHEHGDHSAGWTHQPRATVVTAQTNCPIMGGAVDENVFIEYQGQRVYFCCPGCDKTFLENPEPYVARLPQFRDAMRAVETEMARTGHNH
jgi:YHS domain-containing protein